MWSSGSVLPVFRALFIVHGKRLFCSSLFEGSVFAVWYPVKLFDNEFEWFISKKFVLELCTWGSPWRMPLLLLVWETLLLLFSMETMLEESDESFSLDKMRIWVWFTCTLPWWCPDSICMLWPSPCLVFLDLVSMATTGVWFPVEGIGDLVSREPGWDRLEEQPWKYTNA